MHIQIPDMYYNDIYTIIIVIINIFFYIRIKWPENYPRETVRASIIYMCYWLYYFFFVVYFTFQFFQRAIFGILLLTLLQRLHLFIIVIVILFFLIIHNTHIYSLFLISILITNKTIRHTYNCNLLLS